jgi:hypothetical protein
MNMKSLLFYLTVWAALFCVSCKDMYKDLKEYEGEIVYPGRFDTLIYRVGLERVEIDLMKEGRMPAKNMNLSKALYTVYQVDDNEPVVLDSLYSWVNVPGLNEQRVYQIKVYSIDEYGSMSIPQTCSLIPYTELDKAKLVVTTPRAVMLRDIAIVDWPNSNGLNSVLADFVELKYNYTDDSDHLVENTKTKDDDLVIELYNLAPNAVNTVNFTYRMIPKMASGLYIIDTVELASPLSLNMPSPDKTILVSEEAVFRANGVANPTLRTIADLTRFSMPLCTKTFSDLYYFGELEELDLTGRDGVKNVMPTYSLTGNGNTYTFGGGDYQPYIQKVENFQWYKYTLNKPVDAIYALLYKLDRGDIKKVKYRRYSMGPDVDEALEPYVQKGIVDLVDDDWFPDEAPVDPRLAHPGNVDFAQYVCSVRVLGDDHSQVPDIQSLDDPNSVFTVTPGPFQGTANFAPTFDLTLPREYRYDFELYQYLKFKVFLKVDDETILNTMKTAAFNSGWANCRRIWLLTRYQHWTACEPQNPFVANGNDNTNDYRFTNADQENGAAVIPKDNVNGNWFEVVIEVNLADRTMDTRDNHNATYANPQNGHYHFRVLMFCLARQSGLPNNPFPNPSPVTYYFADMKFTKGL